MAGKRPRNIRPAPPWLVFGRDMRYPRFELYYVDSVDILSLFKERGPLQQHSTRFQPA